jgi:hypothetical protein
MLGLLRQSLRTGRLESLVYAPRSSRPAHPRAAAAVAVPAGTASAAPRADAQPPPTTPWAHEVSSTNVLPGYARPQLARSRWQNLNGTWQFAEASAGESPPTGTDLADQIFVPYPVESALSGIQRHVDHMWCCRTFTVWPSSRGERLLLHFPELTKGLIRCVVR